MLEKTMTTQAPVTGTKRRDVSIMMRLEGITALVVAIALYSQQSGDWGAFLLLFLAPDLAFIALMINKEFGRLVYNLVHTYTLPLILAVVALAAGWGAGVSLALIWTAHISLDRAVGYGIRYSTEGKDSHLQRI